MGVGGDELDDGLLKGEDALRAHEEGQVWRSFHERSCALLLGAEPYEHGAGMLCLVVSNRIRLKAMEQIVILVICLREGSFKVMTACFLHSAGAPRSTAVSMCLLLQDG